MKYVYVLQEYGRQDRLWVYARKSVALAAAKDGTSGIRVRYVNNDCWELIGSDGGIWFTLERKPIIRSLKTSS
jgi:hypothetical protein